MVTWEQLYDALGIRDFIYFISSPSIQDELFPVKIVFIFFAAVFFCAVIYFYVNSSYIQYEFLQDVTEFFSKQTYGLLNITRRWKNIKKRTDSGSESELKLAIIEADDLLYQVLEEMGFQGETFEELVTDASKRVLPNFQEVLEAHALRNSIVYEPDSLLDVEKAKKILSVYENTVKNIAAA